MAAAVVEETKPRDDKKKITMKTVKAKVSHGNDGKLHHEKLIMAKHTNPNPPPKKQNTQKKKKTHPQMKI
jgi:hypothetical protein